MQKIAHEGKNEEETEQNNAKLVTVSSNDTPLSHAVLCQHFGERKIQFLEQESMLPFVEFFSTDFGPVQIAADAYFDSVVFFLFRISFSTAPEEGKKNERRANDWIKESERNGITEARQRRSVERMCDRVKTSFNLRCFPHYFCICRIARACAGVRARECVTPFNYNLNSSKSIN